MGLLIVFDLLESIHNFLTKREHIDEETIPIVLMFLGSFALRPFLPLATMRKSQSWIAFELKAAAAAMVISIPVACAAGLILQNFYPVPWHAVVTVWAWSLFILFMWCSLYFSIKQWQESSEEKERLLRAESEVREARLLALRCQLNPHFLFNWLEKCSFRPSFWTEMLPQQHGCWRRSENFFAQVLIRSCRQRCRFTRRLFSPSSILQLSKPAWVIVCRFEITIPPETVNAMVPSMLLQPLVENAVRHGVSPLTNGGTIAIKSMLHQGALRISLEILEGKMLKSARRM